MTPYTYECQRHGGMQVEFPMGQAPTRVFCHCGGPAQRAYDSAVWQFPYGKDTFHGPTIGERHEREMTRAIEDGRRPPEPVGFTHF